MRAGAVLLAAGESTRMSEAKQLLDWEGVPLLQYQIKQLDDTSVQEIVVVLGHRSDEFIPLIHQTIKSPKVHVVINTHYLKGKTTSIKAGLRNFRGTPHMILLLAVDQPRPREVLQRLLDEHWQRGHTISVPSYRGQYGHPPVFDASLIPELLTISEERKGIREVIERHRGELWEVTMDSPIVLTDLNTSVDYRRAKKRTFSY